MRSNVIYGTLNERQGPTGSIGQMKTDAATEHNALWIVSTYRSSLLYSEAHGVTDETLPMSIKRGLLLLSKVNTMTLLSVLLRI